MSKRNRVTSGEGSSKKSKPESAEQSTHILDLNDDCFEAIFQYLLPIDLCAVNKTCRRFAPLTEEWFQRKYLDLELSLSTQFEENPSGRKFRLSSDILVVFGKFIQKLKVDKVTVDFSDESRSRYKEIIDKYPHHRWTFNIDNGVSAAELCNVFGRYNKLRYKARRINAEEAIQIWDDVHANCSQLQELTITDSDLEYMNPNNIQAKPRELKTLQLVHCLGVDKHFDQINGYFTNFKCLTLQTGDPWNGQYTIQYAFLRQRFPQLEEISCANCPDVHLKEFIRRNPQIEKIDGHDTTCDELNFIADHCKNVRNISFGCWQGPNHVRRLVEGLGRFEKLEELHLNCHENTTNIPVLEMLARKNSLETLSLASAKLDRHFCDALCKLTNLKTLKLHHHESPNGNMIQKLLTGLTLTNLELIWDATIPFEEIETAVKYGRTLESMTIAGNFLDDDRFLRLINARKESGASSCLDISLYDCNLQRRLRTDSLVDPQQAFDLHSDPDWEEPAPVHQVGEDAQHNGVNERLIKLKSIAWYKMHCGIYISCDPLFLFTP